MKDSNKLKGILHKCQIILLGVRGGIIMSKYRKIIKCDVCGNDILMPVGRIEWGYDDSKKMHVCHHDCSYGLMNDGSENLQAIKFDKKIDPDYVYIRLNLIPDDYGLEYKDECNRLKNKIFEQNTVS